MRTMDAFWSGQLKSKEWLIVNLRKHVKKLKTKNTFIVIIGGALLTALTVLSVLK